MPEVPDRSPGESRSRAGCTPRMVLRGVSAALLDRTCRGTRAGLQGQASGKTSWLQQSSKYRAAKSPGRNRGSCWRGGSWLTRLAPRGGHPRNTHWLAASAPTKRPTPLPGGTRRTLLSIHAYRPLEPSTAGPSRDRGWRIAASSR